MEVLSGGGGGWFRGDVVQVTPGFLPGALLWVRSGDVPVK